MHGRHFQDGVSLLELVFAAGLLATIAALAVPSIFLALDHFRTLGAVRYLSSRLQQTRMEAVTRAANAAIRFDRTSETYAFAIYVDGNGDGVRTQDIQRGVDPKIRQQERLSDHFPGVEFGALLDLPPADPAGTPPGRASGKREVL